MAWLPSRLFFTQHCQFERGGNLELIQNASHALAQALVRLITPNSLTNHPHSEFHYHKIVEHILNTLQLAAQLSV